MSKRMLTAVLMFLNTTDKLEAKIKSFKERWKYLSSLRKP